MDGREVDEEYPLDDADIGMVPANGLVDDPLEHVVLVATRERMYMNESLATERTGLSDQSSPKS